MAEDKPEPQKLNFGKDGELLVSQSFSAPSGLLHMTEDGGFFYRPGEPLKDQEIADKLPEPYKTKATEFIAALPPPEPPVEPPVEPEEVP